MSGAPAATDAAAAKPSISERLKSFFTLEHVEVTGRLSVAMFLSYLVAVLDVNVMSPFMRLLITVLVPFVAMLMPTLMFAYSGIILPMSMIFLTTYGFVTALLAAAVAGGNGAFCALYAVIIFWLSFLRWDKATGPGTSIFIIAVTFVSILAYPDHNTVQEGFDVVVKTNLSNGADGIDSVAATYLPENTFAALHSQTLSETLRGMLVAGSGLEFDADTNSSVVEMEDTPTFLEVPSTGGDLAGLTVEVVDTGVVGDDAFARFHVPGGMWMVRAAWTATGVNNPLALFYNLFVMWGWLFFCLAFTYLIPPFRTLRFALTKGMIPAALSDTSSYIDLHSKVLHADKSVSAEDAADDVTKKKQTGGKQIRHANILLGGNLAKLTAFEPRLTRCGFTPPVCTWLRLKSLSDAVLNCVLVSIGVNELLTESDHEEFKAISKHHVKFTKVWKSCALALQTGNAGAIVDAAAAEESASDADSDPSCAYDPFRMHVYTKAVADTTKSYLLAMDGKVSEDETKKRSWWSARSEIKLNCLPFYIVFTAYLKGLINVLIMLCQKSYWSSLSGAIEFQKFVWCVKYTAGFVILLVATIYWHGFGESFSITVSSDRGIFGSVYSELNGGWAMIAYCFATTQSMEGTIKKGILRAAGTITGGFVGWLGLLACEDSRFDTGFNPYGIVAWMTVTSAMATYVATNRGFFARLGLSGDYSFGPIYFVITEVVVVFYALIFFGPEKRDDVALNRIVSNLAGIVFSMILAFLPFGVWGGSPSHCREIVKGIEKDTAGYLELLLQSQGFTSASTLEKMSKDILKKSDGDLNERLRLHAMAKDLFEDASRLSVAPFLKTDPRLGLEVALLARDVHVVPFVAIIASRIVTNASFRRFALEHEETRAKIESFLETFRGGTGSKDTTDTGSGVLGVDIEAGDDDEIREAKLVVELLLRVLKLLEQRAKSHHQALDSIKWGYRFQSVLDRSEKTVNC